MVGGSASIYTYYTENFVECAKYYGNVGSLTENVQFNYTVCCLAMNVETM